MKLSDRIFAWARNIKRDGVTLWFACKHSDTPLLAKALGIFVVAYALSPIDLVPDFIPVLGYLDDVILLPVLIWCAIRLLPLHVLEESRAKSVQWISQEGRKPRSNWGILLVVGIWVAISWGLWAYFREGW